MGSRRLIASSAVGIMCACAVLAGCTGSSPKSAQESTSATSTSTGSTSSPSTTSGNAVALQSAYVSVIDKALPSVVLIRTQQDLGSGVVFDDHGDIVTNDHVVGSATTFQIVLSGSTTPLSAKLVGAYPPDDLAVVKVNGAKSLHPATFADSSKLQVGDIVLAMGNPLGLASSVTNGIVSAVGRTVTEPSGGGSPGATLPDTIQTSAAINPGNSGGALVDLAGEVVGIPTLAALDQQTGGGAAPGIGFAISSNIVKDIAGQIAAHGKVIHSHRAALGIQATTVTDANGQPAGAGIYAVEPGSAAGKAGLRAGDVIVSVNGTATPTVQALTSVLANLQPGQTVSVKVNRAGGGTQSVDVTLGSLPG